MTTSLIGDLLAQAQRDLAAREARIVAELLRSYGIALARIRRDLLTIEQQIAEAVASGEPVDAGWLSRQRWWREVETSIRREMAIYQQAEIAGIAAAQTSGVRIAVGMAGEIAKAAGAPFEGRVYAEAFERWVSAIQPDSPLRTISLARHGEMASAAIVQRMTEGVGSGKAPRSIVREIMADTGGVGNEARIMTLARTETMRSFRGASADAYARLPDGVITGYRWLATKSPRTCIACIAMDGTVTPYYPAKQHPACRCVAIPVVSNDIVPGANRGGETGEEWFAKQPEAIQRQMLLSDERYAAYKTGTLLSDMVTTRHSPVWGDSIGVRPVRDMPKIGAETVARYKVAPKPLPPATDPTPTTIMAAD